MKTLGNVMQVAGIVVFVSSFFVKDNARAVKRRWWGVGIGAAGWGGQLVANKKAKA